MKNVTARSRFPRSAPTSRAAIILVDRPSGRSVPPSTRSPTMQWIEPAFCDIRLGFEVTAYVYVR